jgi:peptidoglycan L-alanyl-D-glutamate endopeptidase CwlK
MPVLRPGARGAEVTKLQSRLKELGFDPQGVDSKFGEDTRDALVAFQISKGLPPNGRADSDTLQALGLLKVEPVPIAQPSIISTTPASPAAAARPASVSPFPAATVSVVSKMFPGTPVANIQANLPIVLQALADAGLADKQMVLMALGTIRAETASFRAISEGISKYNTTPGRHPFNLYDDRASLGNRGRPDGARFKGRGFVQLTGRDNYRVHGAAIGLGNQLITNPELANRTDIAAKLLASFLKNKEQDIRDALRTGDLKLARKLVNGGSHGLTEFTDAYNIGKALIT